MLRCVLRGVFGSGFGFLGVERILGMEIDRVWALVVIFGFLQAWL